MADLLADAQEFGGSNAKATPAEAPGVLGPGDTHSERVPEIAAYPSSAV